MGRGSREGVGTEEKSGGKQRRGVYRREECVRERGKQH